MLHIDKIKTQKSSYHYLYFLELQKKITAQLKNVTEDGIFVKVFL